MDVGQMTQAAFLELLKRLQGRGGYTDEDGSIRVTELSAVAKVAELASEAIVAASKNLVLSSADEALDALERVRALAANSSLSAARRQARLLAHSMGAGKAVPARIANAIATYLGVTTGSTVAPDSVDATDHRAHPATGLVVARVEPAATTRQQRRDLAPVLDRGLPARAISAGISTGSAVWGAALDSVSIAVAEAVAVPAQTKARVAPIEVYPGSIITREQWIEWQSLLCWKSRNFGLLQSGQGRTICRSFTLASGSNVVLDGPANSSVNWALRVVQAWGVASASAVTDPTTLPDTDHVWLPASKLGSAGSGYTHTMQTVAGASSGITLAVNGTGNLVVTNGSGAARNLLLMIRCTPSYSLVASPDSQPWIDTSSMTSAAVSEIHAASVICDATPTQFAGVKAGALRRVIYTGGLTTTEANGRKYVVLDSSEDWRNRYVLVATVSLEAGTALAGGGYLMAASADPMPGRGGASGRPRLFATGAGAAIGSDAVLALQHPDSISAPNVWLFADSATGNLVAEMKAASTNTHSMVMALVTATERTTGTSVVTQVPVHATQVQTIDVEQPLNCGVFGQGHQGGAQRYTLADPAPKAIPTCPPLGLVSGSLTPPRPLAWLVRERLGDANDGTVEVRQRIYSQRKLITSLSVPPLSVIGLDIASSVDASQVGVSDQVDYRDRMVYVDGRVIATTDIRLSAASQVSDVTAVAVSATLYTGPYGDVTVALTADVDLVFTFSRALNGGLHSRLTLKNKHATLTYYANLAVECSGQIGLTDLRSYGTLYEFTCASGDALEFDETRGCADDYGITGGSLRS